MKNALLFPGRHTLPLLVILITPFLHAQNITLRQNANGDQLIWPLNPNFNVFIGEDSGNGNTGILNTAVGSNTLVLNSGNFNSAFGSGALYSNLSGYSNTAIGFEALRYNKGRSRSTAIGFNAIFHADSSTSTDNTFNTAVGCEALYGSSIPANNTGTRNTAMGDAAMYSNASGSNNTAYGFNTLSSNVSGSNNSVVGYEAGKNTTGSGNVFFGYRAGMNEGGSNKLYIDNSGAGSSTAFIYGDFSNKLLRTNSYMEIYSSSASNYGLYVDRIIAPGSNSDLPAIIGLNDVDAGFGVGVKGQGGEVGVVGVCIQNGGPQGTGVRGFSTGPNPMGSNCGVFGQSSNGNYNYGGLFEVTNGAGVGVQGTGGNIGVNGMNQYVGSGLHAGVMGTSNGANTGTNINHGVYGKASNAESNIGVYGETTVAATSENTGMMGIASGAAGNNAGVYGVAFQNSGAKFGVRGHASGAGFNYGIFGSVSAGVNNYAGYFDGKTYVADYLGIHTNPSHEIHVKQLGLSASNGIKFERNDNANNWVTNIDAADDYNFYYGGILKGYIRDNDGVYVVASDKQLKQDIEVIPPVIDKVMKLIPSRYYYIHANNSGQLKSNGFIAQDVEPLFPEVVSEKNGYLGISYESMIPIAFKAIQEQQAIILAQEERIAKLEYLVQQLTVSAGNER